MTCALNTFVKESVSQSFTFNLWQLAPFGPLKNNMLNKIVFGFNFGEIFEQNESWHLV